MVLINIDTTPENLEVDGNKTKSQRKDQLVRTQCFKEGLRGQVFFSLRKEKVNEDQAFWNVTGCPRGVVKSPDL